MTRNDVLPCELFFSRKSKSNGTQSSRGLVHGAHAPRFSRSILSKTIVRGNFIALFLFIFFYPPPLPSGSVALRVFINRESYTIRCFRYRERVVSSFVDASRYCLQIRGETTRWLTLKLSTVYVFMFVSDNIDIFEVRREKGKFTSISNLSIWIIVHEYCKQTPLIIE